ncbi:MAG: hypothetical protein AAGG51_10720 [Cyanobacteria bacterium P01_G01_bin.54]
MNSSLQAVIRQALSTGYLSLQSENQLRHLLHNTRYDGETLWAFTRLQIATMEGTVIQQSRQQLLESCSLEPLNAA